MNPTQEYLLRTDATRRVTAGSPALAYAWCEGAPPTSIPGVDQAATAVALAFVEGRHSGDDRFDTVANLSRVALNGVLLFAGAGLGLGLVLGGPMSLAAAKVAPLFFFPAIGGAFAAVLAIAAGVVELVAFASLEPAALRAWLMAAGVRSTFSPDRRLRDLVGRRRKAEAEAHALLVLDEAGIRVIHLHGDDRIFPAATSTFDVAGPGHAMRVALTGPDGGRLVFSDVRTDRPGFPDLVAGVAAGSAIAA